MGVFGWGVYPGRTGCLPRGVSAPEGVCQGGGGVCLGMCEHPHCPLHAGTHKYTPPVNRITDRCKNITFPQLPLRAVNRMAFSFLLRMIIKKFVTLVFGNCISIVLNKVIRLAIKARSSMSHFSFLKMFQINRTEEI